MTLMYSVIIVTVNKRTFYLFVLFYTSNIYPPGTCAKTQYTVLISGHI